jgi:MFS family permease
MLASAVVGSGLGFLNTAIIVTLQSSVQWQQRGVVTGLVQFSRTIGGAVGVGLLGGILSAAVGPRASEILDPLRRAAVPPREFEALTASLTAGLVGIYILLAVVALVAVIIAWRRAPAVDITASPAGGAAEPPA